MLGKPVSVSVAGTYKHLSCSACESTRVILTLGFPCSAPRVSHPPSGTQDQLGHIILLAMTKAQESKWPLRQQHLLRHKLRSGNSVQFSSVTQSCPTLYDPMDCSIPGFPVHHQLPEFTQIHVYWVSDAIQPSHPLSSPSPPTFNLSQHQGLFKWVSSSHQLVKILEFQLQHQSFQWAFRTDFL